MRRPSNITALVLVGLLGPGCRAIDPGSGPPSGLQPIVAMLQQDFSSSFDGNPAHYWSGAWSAPDRYAHPGAGPALTIWLFDAAMAPGIDLEATRSQLTLTRVSDGQPVAGTVRVGWYGMDGSAIDPNERAISFVPNGPLAPGWHVLRMDIGPTLARFTPGSVMAYAGRRVGDVLYARFRMDSAPTWVATLADHVEPYPYEYTRLFARMSEPAVGVDWTGTNVEVRHDGVVQECTGLTFGDEGFSVTCPSPLTAGVRIGVELDSPAMTGPAGERPTLQEMPPGLVPFNWPGSPVSPDFGIEAADAASR